MHKIETVIGPEPVVSVPGGLDLLDQVSRERFHPAAFLRIADHALSVPQIEAFAGPEPDITVRVLVQAQNRVVADPLPAGDHSQITGKKPRTPARKDRTCKNE